eukprot:10942339-Karenia_brevis.AAC.1
MGVPSLQGSVGASASSSSSARPPAKVIQKPKASSTVAESPQQQLVRDERELMLRCGQLPPVPLPPPQSLPISDDVVTFDDLLTSSIQAED